MNADGKTKELLKDLAERYGLERLVKVLKTPESKLFKSDIYISLRGIVEAEASGGDTLQELKEVKNIYGSPVFALNPSEGTFMIKDEPDFGKALGEMEKYSFCFKLSPYHMVNTFLALLESQVAGFNLDDLIRSGEAHIAASIKDSLENNPNWKSESMTSENPVLIMPVGAAGCGKSTFYRELSDVINISCDNIRYLLFKEFGPCFASWESCLSWWVVNYLTDEYLSKGYSVFYNGVNTDLEYRSPITMEDPDPVFQGMPYDVRIVYFEPPVSLTTEELEELSSVNLWETPVDQLELSEYSGKVAEVLRMIRDNYKRTLERTKDISSGSAEQDPFDILYAVPAPVVKLFVEQSFDRPRGENVIVVERKDIPDPEERSAFYRKYAEKTLNRD